MDQQEAERVAQAIRQSGLTDLEVMRVRCMDYTTQNYQVEADYHGPDKRLGNVILTGGIKLWVKSPRHWSQLARIIRDGIVER